MRALPDAPGTFAHPVSQALDVEVVIVGAGISGIGAGIELLREGISSFVVLEAADDLGGTWRDNTYPGVAVDIPSISYSFSFETGYPWSREFAEGAEIHRYIRHCAEKYGVAERIRYGARVLHSRFHADRDAWSTHLADGTVLTSRYVIAATGLFGAPKLPPIPGLETFTGKKMHSGRWDHGHDLSNRRVAVIGTGASAVQIVPELAARVAELRVFQRTPIWIAPRMDRPLQRASRFSPRRFAPARSVMRFFSELGVELLTFSIVNHRRLPYLVLLVQWLVRAWMRRQVDSSALAEALVPRYRLGCKRPSTSNRYLSAFNGEHVRLITTPIERICPQGIVTADQTLHEVDTMILATGFLTTEKGNGPSFEVFGREGVELGQFWEEHRLQAYAGVSVPGFPNFFLTAGPYSGGFNWFSMLEANLAHLIRCLRAARARGATRVEVRRDAHERYMRQVWQRSDGTVFKDRACVSANSYYLDRHGDASLPLPHTPWWRAIRGRWRRTQGYAFSGRAERTGAPR